MSDFWLGVTSGLAVYMAFMLVGAIVLYGEQTEVNYKTIVTYGVGTVLFMLASWWLATFGGSP